MIQVDRLTKYFGHVMAVNNVSFQVEKNEIVGLLGNNGAGKTTIMRILTTYLPASSGVARVAGFDVMTDSMEVPQTHRLPAGEHPALRRDARRGIPRLPGQTQGRRAPPPAAARRLLHRTLPVWRACAAPCSARCRRAIGQRVGLADAMIADPPILILDEPTDGLDPGQKPETLGMLRELGQDHTIMLSSHMLTEVETIVQRVHHHPPRTSRAMPKKLSDLETDAVIVVEVRGPADQVGAALRGHGGRHPGDAPRASATA